MLCLLDFSFVVKRLGRIWRLKFDEGLKFAPAQQGIDFNLKFPVRLTLQFFLNIAKQAWRGTFGFKIAKNDQKP